MLVVLQFLAVLCCILFAGAAIYINLVEHPARMGCDTKDRCNSLGAKLQKGDGYAGSVGQSQLSGGHGCLAARGWPPVVDRGGTDWSRGALYIYRRHAHEQ